MIMITQSPWLLLYRGEQFLLATPVLPDGSWDFAGSFLEGQPLTDGIFDPSTGFFSFNCIGFDKRSPGISFAFNGVALPLDSSRDQVGVMAGTAHYFSVQPRINPGGLVAGSHVPLFSSGPGITTLEVIPFRADPEGR